MFLTISPPVARMLPSLDFNVPIKSYWTSCQNLNCYLNNVPLSLLLMSALLSCLDLSSLLWSRDLINPPCSRDDAWSRKIHSWTDSWNITLAQIPYTLLMFLLSCLGNTLLGSRILDVPDYWPQCLMFQTNLPLGCSWGVLGPAVL